MFVYTEEEKNFLVSFNVAEAEANIMDRHAWVFALLSACIAHYEWHNWLYNTAVFVGIFWWVGRYERRKVEKMRPFFDALMEKKWDEKRSSPVDDLYD